jgi:hypothetical protein
MVLINLGKFGIFLITLPVVDTSEYLIELCISEVFTQSTFVKLGFTMKLTHLSRVQHLIIKTRGAVFRHKSKLNTNEALRKAD